MSDQDTTGQPEPKAQTSSVLRGVWSFLSENGTATIALIVAVGLMGSMFLLSGCDMGDAIRVRTPAVIRMQPPDVPSSMSLNDALGAYDAWKALVMTQDRAWAESLSRAEQWRSVLGSLTTDALAYAAPFLGGLPGGTLIAAAAAGFAGLMFPKPGTTKKIETIASQNYDMGRKEALDTIKSANGGA